MKKLLLAAVVAMSLPAVAAAESWKMTGVMAAYPGTVNQPFSAPIVNNKEYASEDACNKAILKIASAHPVLAMINNGAVLPADKAAGGYVAVAAACLKQD